MASYAELREQNRAQQDEIDKLRKELGTLKGRVTKLENAQQGGDTGE